MKREEIQRWFNERREELGDDKTKQIAVWFASRCAMRVAPVAFFENVKQDKISLTIAVLWSTTASWVASNRVTHNVAVAVAVAVAAAAITYAAAAAVYAATAAEEDLRWLEQSDYQIAGSSPPLWHDAPNPLKEIWKRGRNYWQEAPGNTYAFFIDHYDRILRGDVPDWPILEALASKEAIEVWRTKDIHKIAYYIQKLKLDRGEPHILDSW